MKNVRVENMTSDKGNKIANQFIIIGKNFEIFQSYETVIVKKVFSQKGTKIFLDKEKWDYSVTTGKYRNLFLNEKKQETEEKIKKGIYKLKNLN